jgi:hypothetical protein
MKGLVVGIFVFLLTAVGTTASEAAGPELVISVGDTVVSPLSVRTRIPVYIDNFYDTVFAIRLTLATTQPNLVKFAGMDTAGTLVSGFDFAGAFDPSGDSSEILFLCFADVDPYDGQTNFGIQPQSGDITLYALVNTYLPLDSVQRSILEIHEPLEIVTPDARRIGAIIDTIYDTTFFKCTDWSLPDSASCAAWEPVDPDTTDYDSLEISVSEGYHYDSSLAWFLDGSVRVPACQVCDLDCDDLVDIADLTRLISCLYIVPDGCTELGLCDWDCSGAVDIGDLTGLIGYLYLGAEIPNCGG